MSQHEKSNLVRFACAVLVGVVCLTPPVRQMAKYPSHIEIAVGQQAVVPIGLPVEPEISGSSPKVVEVKSMPRSNHNRTWQQDVAVVSHNVGDATVTTKLFGFVPWKAVHVRVVEPASVYPGGQCVGVRLKSRGAIVIGYQRHQSPAWSEQLEIGDVIERVNGHLVTSADSLRWWVNHAGDDVTLTVRHGHKYRTIHVTPHVGTDGNRHLGLYIRDVTAGIGTLTFYDGNAHRFGALGHVITDIDTGQIIEGTGSLYDAEVTGMVKGHNGEPGEKRGKFDSKDGRIGKILENTDYGVFGSLSRPPAHAYYKNPIPVALPSQVHPGKAKILTVLHGQDVRAFTVEIESTVAQDTPNTKGMVIHVTDKTLLRETGGIVQGMSGSPIIQDGRLVGAVTHVFMSDVTRGYGVYAAWMVQQSHDLAPNEDKPYEQTAFMHLPPKVPL